MSVKRKRAPKHPKRYEYIHLREVSGGLFRWYNKSGFTIIDVSVGKASRPIILNLVHYSHFVKFPYESQIIVQIPYNRNPSGSFDGRISF